MPSLFSDPADVIDDVARWFHRHFDHVGDEINFDYVWIENGSDIVYPCVCHDDGEHMTGEGDLSGMVDYILTIEVDE